MTDTAPGVATRLQASPERSPRDRSAAAGPPASAGPLLVVECGEFTLCDLHSADQTSMGLSGVLRLMGIDRIDKRHLTGVRRISDDTGDRGARVVRVGGAVLTIAGPDALWAYSDSTQRWVALQVPHLLIAEQAADGTSTEAIAAQVGLDLGIVAACLDDLAVLGVIRLEELGTDFVDGSHAAAQPSGPIATLQARVRRAKDLNRAIRQVRARVSSGLDNTASTSAPEPIAWAESNGVLSASLDRPVTRSPQTTRPDRVPVLSFWATAEGPHLGAAAVVAYARAFDGGALNERYEFRRPVPGRQVLEEIAALDGPLILLCSNYVWSVEANLALAAQAIALNPAVVVVHGGPSTPRYDEDCELFLRGLTGSQIVVNGEGEITFAETLAAFDPQPDDDRLDLERLDGIAGVRYISPTDGSVVRNPDRPRHGHLEEFPSALLSGEFDEIADDVLMHTTLPIESNRGCPYGCTFCDWGQATSSRLRMFPLERVFGEMQWMARRSVGVWIMADSNFGMVPRDITIIDEVVRIHEETGVPNWIAVAPPKNTTRRFVAVVDRLIGAGISMKAALALQTRDEATLLAIRRENIGTKAYDELKDELRDRGLPLTCDLMMGLPGATVESFKADLQWCSDEAIRAHTWPTFVLPNAPMNAPEYRAEHGIRTVDGLIVETSTFDRAERHEMDRLAHGYQVMEFLGALRHVLRFLQWEHDRPVMDTVHELIRLTDATPEKFPLTTWLLRHSDVFTIPPVGWAPFFDEVRTLVTEQLGIPASAGLETAITVNHFVMPARGRSFPARIELAHDFVAYTSDASSTGDTAAFRPLESYPAGTLEIVDDPDGVCNDLGRLSAGHEPEGYHGDFWVRVHWELLSPLTTYLPMSPGFVHVARAQLRPQVVDAELAAELAQEDDSGTPGATGAVAVGIPVRSTRTT